MLPFSLSFRRMLRKYIPQKTTEDIDEHESLMALRHQLLHEINIVPSKYRKNPKVYQSKIKDNITDITKKAQTIFKDVEKEYNAVHQLWIARREYALEQGNLLQIPPTFEGLGRYIKTSFEYQKVQVKTLPILWKNQVSYFLKNLTISKIAIIVGAVILIIVGLIAVISPIEKITKQPFPDKGSVVNPDSTYSVQTTQVNTSATIC